MLFILNENGAPFWRHQGYSRHGLLWEYRIGNIFCIVQDNNSFQVTREVVANLINIVEPTTIDENDDAPVFVSDFVWVKGRHNWQNLVYK